MTESKALHKHKSIPASYSGPLPKKAMLSKTTVPLEKKKKNKTKIQVCDAGPSAGGTV